MTFGTYPKLSLTNARARQAKAREMLEEEGKDPGALLVKSKRTNREAPTVNELADEYIEKWAKPRKRSWKSDDWMLKSNVLPFIGRKKAADVTRRDIILILDAVVDRGAPIAANRTLALIRKMFRVGIDRELVPHSPCEAMPAPAPANQRDRVLNTAEIKKFWTKLEGDDISTTPEIRYCLQLLLTTAQRRCEVVTARWADIDLTTGWWTIPEDIAKNGLPHRVPLSPLACRLFKAAKKDAGDSVYVFPNRNGVESIRPDTVSKAIRRNRDKFGLEHFAPHDLRRSAASLMASMGTPRLHISKVLNHVESGVTAVYDRHGYDQEKRKALNAWGRKLESIISGKKAKVIELKTG
jgi:integrase